MFAIRHIPYQLTGSFSKIIIDYIDQCSELKPFYSQPPSLDGLKQVIAAKQQQPVDRKTLVNVLTDQYKQVTGTNTVKQNIHSLLSENTFTICTAHQPNIFTGPLYFIYKILHTIKLASHLKKELPQYNFVPVYYIGSEDADLAELNHFYVFGKKYEWNTGQQGAVGRMTIDKELVRLIGELSQQIGIEPYGPEFIQLLKEHYRTGLTIQIATFGFVNALFGKYGLVVLIADDERLKCQMIPVFEDDIFRQYPSSVVEATCKKLSEQYNVQAHPREINLFYLKENIRQRIVRTNNHFVVHDTDIRFSEVELRNELHQHPGRFSPNVILRGLYQETILPNLAFIGGGGELAYWLQLKDLFEQYKVSFPVLILRNSFLVIENTWKERIERLGLDSIDFFKSENELMKLVVQKHSGHKVSLNGNFERANDLFEQIKLQAGQIDPTLSQHVAALKAQSLKTLQELEKKMLRAEKRKFSDQQRQIEKIKSNLFPKNGLQERIENIAGYYSRWGTGFIDELYNSSLALEQMFTLLTHQTN